MKIFSERLIGARNAKGWSQTELAHEIEASLRSVQNWESGDFSPQGRALRKLSERLEVSIPYLLGEGADAGASGNVDLLHSQPAMAIRGKVHQYIDTLMDRAGTDQSKLWWIYHELRAKLPLDSAPLRTDEQELAKKAGEAHDKKKK